jgi:hypothetical protein
MQRVSREWEERLRDPSRERCSNRPFGLNVDQACYCPLISGPMLSRTGKFRFAGFGSGGKARKCGPVVCGQYRLEHLAREGEQ